MWVLGTWCRARGEGWTAWRRISSFLQHKVRFVAFKLLTLILILYFCFRYVLKMSLNNLVWYLALKNVKTKMIRLCQSFYS